ncbi:hypothetical protein MASR2M44_00990 [Bacteroidota bacterium]
MKKIVTIVLFMLGLAQAKTQAQAPSFALRVENEVMVSSTVYEFDVMLYATGATTSWELATATVNINMNSSFRNAGSISVTAVSSSSTLTNTAQAPTSFAYNAVNNIVQIAAKAPPGTGSGSIIPQSGSRIIRLRLSNSGSWGSGVAPNFAFRFTSPATAINAYIGGVNTQIAGTTASAGQAFCYTPVYYTSGSNAWNVTPTASRDAVIMSGSANAASGLSCRNLRIQSGASLTVSSGQTLSLSGNLSNDGTLTGTGANIEFIGTGDKLNQAWTGNGSAFRDAIFGVAGQAGIKTLSAPLSITRNVQLQGTATLAASGNLTLVSNALGTARLLELPAGASVTGNVTVERFIPGSSGRKYRYLAAPFATGPTLAASWQQQIHITGPGTGGSLCPSPSPNSNGFDATQTNAPSMFTFNETTAVNTNTAGNNGGTVYNNAWVTVPNTNSTTLQAGKGYKVFVRGNKSQGCDLVNGTNPSPNDVTLSGSGVLAQGTFNFGVTYSSNNGEGWNLLGNPYPCAIDWNAAGWTKTNLENKIWVFRPAGNHFATYNVLSGGVNFGSNIIESGGAFFVHATASSPVLTANESVKIGNSPSTPLFKSQLKKLSLTFVKVGEVQDEILVGMAAEATDANDAFDAEKMSNPALNVYARSSDGKQQAINIFKAAQPETRVPLGINTTFTGEHRFSFKGETEFNAYDVLLEDRYAGIIQMVNDRPNYTFEINSDPASYGEGRFSLLFVDRGDFDYLKRVKSIYSSVTTSLNAYPNPSKGLVQLQTSNLQGKSAEVKVYNAIGAEIQRMEQAIDKGICSFSLDLSDQASGVYFVELSDSQGNTRKAKVVKSNN